MAVPQRRAAGFSAQSLLLQGGPLPAVSPQTGDVVPVGPALCLGQQKKVWCQQKKSIKECILQYTSSLLLPWSDCKLMLRRLRCSLGCYSKLLLLNPEKLRKLLPVSGSSSSLRLTSFFSNILPNHKCQQKLIYYAAILME